MMSGQANNVIDVNEKTVNKSFIVSSRAEAENFLPPNGFIDSDAAANDFLSKMFDATSKNPTSLDMAQTRLHLTRLLADQEDLINYMEKRVAEETNSCTPSSSAGVSFNVTNPNGTSAGALGIVGSGSILRAWESLLCYRRTLDTLPKNSKKFYVDIHRHREEPFSFTSVSSPAFLTQLDALQHIKNRLPVRGSSSVFNVNSTLENIKPNRLVASPTTVTTPTENRTVPKVRSGVLDSLSKKTIPVKADDTLIEIPEIKKRQKTSQQHEDQHYEEKSLHSESLNASRLSEVRKEEPRVISKQETPVSLELSCERSIVDETKLNSTTAPAGTNLKAKPPVDLRSLFGVPQKINSSSEFKKKESAPLTDVTASLSMSDYGIKGSDDPKSQSQKQQSRSSVSRPVKNHSVSQRFKHEPSQLNKNSITHNISQMSLRNSSSKSSNSSTKQHIEASDAVSAATKNPPSSVEELQANSDRSLLNNKIKAEALQQEQQQQKVAKESSEAVLPSGHRTSTSVTRRRAVQPAKAGFLQEATAKAATSAQKETPGTAIETSEKTATLSTSLCEDIPASTKVITSSQPKSSQSSGTSAQTKKESSVSAAKYAKNTEESSAPTEKSNTPLVVPELTRRRSFTMTRRRSRGGTVLMEDPR